MSEAIDDVGLRTLLIRLDPRLRAALRQALIVDDRHRDELAMALLRRVESQPLADVLDLLTLDPSTRQRVARLLGELQASG